MKDQNQKRVSRGSALALATVGLLLLCIALNCLVGLLPASVKSPNVTGSETFRISGTTKDWLKNLNEDITLTLICEGGRANADGQLCTFFEEYAEQSERITLRVVDSSADATFINAYGGEWPSDMSMIVESSRRYRMIDSQLLFGYYNSLLELDMTADEYASMVEYCNASDTTGATTAQFVESTEAYFDGDSRLTNAISFVTREHISVAYMLTGSGASRLDARMEKTLSQVGYDLRTTLSVAALPDDCDVLIINNPTADLDTVESAALSDYLAGGGDLLLTTAYTVGRLENLDGILSSYGMSFEKEINVVYEHNAKYALGDTSNTYPYLFYSHIAQHAATGAFDGEFVAYYPHNIVVDTSLEGGTVTPWLYTSEAGCVQRYDEESKKLIADAERSVCNFGVIAKKGETSVIWISTPFALTSQVNSGYAKGGNFDLATLALNWMTGVEGEAIAIPSAAMDTSYLSVTVGAAAIWGIVLIFLLPLGVAVTGITVYYLRKKR
ncbi:MAG: Gldg family protein [Clostridia bacterium]|nr:Gldg family protein [Clostridia bacterium]